MSFRIEEKLYIKAEHLIDFKQFLIKHSAKQLYQPRLIKSLYFDNLNFNINLSITLLRKGCLESSELPFIAIRQHIHIFYYI